MKYRWAVVGLPFAPEGLVFEEGSDRAVIRLDYTEQNEALIVRRLAKIVRALEAADRELNRKKGDV